MKTFTDNADRTWTVSINVNTIKRVRDVLGIDLLSIAGGGEENGKDPPLLYRLSDDPVLLVNVLYVVCEPQCTKLGVSDEDFGASLGGDSIETAVNALLDGLIDFFPSGRRRLLATALAKTRELQETTHRLGQARLEELAPQLQRQIEETFKAAGGESSTKSLDAAE